LIAPNTLEILKSRFADIGPLQAADANGLRLPAGFTSRVVAVSGEAPVLGNAYLWHIFPDGGATFPTPDGGWVYTSNSEIPGGAGRGGCGALKFDRDGNLLDAYGILSGTNSNCAGGKTPWGTWMSCEETAGGQVWECNPTLAGQGVARPKLGRFNHEALAVDAGSKIVYMTEDAVSGRFYRFVPSAGDWPDGGLRPALQEGKLQVMRCQAYPPSQLPPDGFNVALPQAVVWEDVVQPDQDQATVRSGLGAVAPGTPFSGGEGLFHAGDLVYFSTKYDNRIWVYDKARSTVEAIYDFNTAAPDDKILSGVDNLTVTGFGDVLVAEDGGDMQICVILPDRRVIPLLQASDLQQGTQAQSEITGPALSPDGKRLYFSAQRSGRNGNVGPGITFEVTLPFSACPAVSCP
jgi:secreted PhoX family phosphatase